MEWEKLQRLLLMFDTDFGLASPGLTPFKEATDASVNCPNSRDIENSFSIHVCHSSRFRLPISFIVLDYAEGVDPDVLNSKETAGLNKVSKCFGKRILRDTMEK